LDEVLTLTNYISQGYDNHGALDKEDLLLRYQDAFNDENVDLDLIFALLENIHHSRLPGGTSLLDGTTIATLSSLAPSPPFSLEEHRLSL
jgi:hypothetical protein